MPTLPKALLLPRWRSSPSAAAVAATTAAALDADANGPTKIAATNGKHPPSSPQTHYTELSPSPFTPNKAWSLAITLIALVSVLALAAIAIGPMQSIGDDSDSALLPDAQLLRTQLKLREFNVSTRTLRHRDSLQVRFAYDATSTALAAATGTTDDWIGAYCIDDEQAHAAVPVSDFIDLRHTGGRTSGSVTFGPMVNMRCSWLFKFVAGSTGTVLATSDFVRFEAGPTEPLQIHLALTARATEMRVHWVSADVQSPVVKFGTSADDLSRTVRATKSSYGTADMCQAPATTVAAQWFRDPGQLFEAVLTDLVPAQTYYYRVGSTDAGANATLSAVHHFTVPPRPGQSPPTASSSTSFFVFGDLNSPVGATEEYAVPGSCGTTMALIARDLARQKDDPTHAYAALVHVGDISYAQGATFVWDQFGALIEPVAASLPYMVSVGNHDYGYLEGNSIDPVKWPRNPVFERDGTHGYQSDGECGVPLEKRFHMPDNGNSVFWYSFASGLTHHVVLSGEHDFSKGSAMHTWLVQDLRAVDRSVTPWLFVHMHRPMYCSVAYAGDYYRSLLYRDELEQLFSDYHVDVVFSGHYHSYERTCAVFDEECYYDARTGDALAPVHIMIGSGGANVDEYSYYDRDWRVQAFQTYGYGRVHVYNATHLHFEFVSNEKEAVVDATWIVSEHNWPRNRVRQYRLSVAQLACAGVAIVTMLLAAGAAIWRRRKCTLGYAKKVAIQEV